MASHSVDARHQTALATLHPVFRWRVDRLLADLRKRGWKPVLVYGARTLAQQRELYKKGVGAKVSWHVPSTTGLLPAGDGKSVDIVHGNAADIIDRRWGWSGPAASKNHQFWKDLGKLAKRHSLEWGGDWPNRDVAHVQMKFIEMPSQSSVIV